MSNLIVLCYLAAKTQRESNLDSDLCTRLATESGEVGTTSMDDISSNQDPRITWHFLALADYFGSSNEMACRSLPE